MAQNNLEAKISLDVSDLKKGLGEAKKAQTDYEKSLDETQKAIIKNNQTSQKYKKAIDDLNDARGKSHISAERYNKLLKRLTKHSKETEVATADLNKRLQQLKNGTGQVESKISSSSRTMASTSTTAAQLGKSIGDISTSSGAAGTSVTSLVNRFAILQNSAGSSATAVKALVSSLTGPAGIALAVSALVPIITNYIKKQDQSSTASAKLKKETEENTRKLRDYVDALDRVSRAQLEGNKGSADQMTTLKLLRGQIENTNISMDLRLDGIQKLRKEFPGYFKDISDEQLLNGNAATSYDTLTNSIIKRAKATAATQSIVENSKREFDLANQLESVQEKLIKAEEQKTRAANNYVKATKTASDGGRTALNEQIRQEGIVTDLLSEELKIKEQIKSITEDNLKLEAIALENAIVIPEIETPEDPENKKSPKVSQAEKDAETIRKINAQLFKDELADAKEAAKVTGGEVAQVLAQETGDFFRFEAFIDIESEDAFREIVAIENKLKELSRSVSDEQFDVLQGFNLDQLTEFQNKLQKFNEDAKLSANIASQSISTVSGAFADSIKTDSELINTISKVIIDASETMLQKLVQDSIKGTEVKKTEAIKGIAADNASSTASGIKAASSTAAASGPAAAFLMPVFIGAMLALVSSSFSKIKFAHGGIVPGGSFTGDKIPAMLNSGEMVLNNGQQANLFKALDGSLSSLQNQSNNDTLVASTVLRGEDIYLSVTRQERIQKRFN